MLTVFGSTGVKKIVVGGDHFVGKTTLIHRSIDLSIDGTKVTLGVNLYVKFVEVDKKPIKLQIWDFGGQKQFRLLGMFERYCEGANGAILIFAQNQYSSVANLRDWFDLVRKYAGKIPIIVAGNKTDLPTSPNLQDEIQKFLENYDVFKIYEISARYGKKEQVDKIFYELTKEMIREK